MEIKKLYTSFDIKTMQLADTARLPGKNRVEEIRNYAKKCTGYLKKADALL